MANIFQEPVVHNLRRRKLRQVLLFSVLAPKILLKT
jgi:hypothetical protein